jgi:predicted nucleotidyltransferase
MSSISMADALFTKTQQRVLGLLYGKPDESFYTNEIVRWAAMGRGTVRRELDRLVSSGLLVVTREGNQLHYQANHACPIYQDLLNIVKKTIGVVDVLKYALLPLDSEIDFAFVYGSVAKGEETAKSDIDVFIASESLAFADVMNVLTIAEEELGRPVNPSIYSREDIRKKLKNKNAFLIRLIEQPKLWVKGDERVIRDIR